MVKYLFSKSNIIDRDKKIDLFVSEVSKFVNKRVFIEFVNKFNNLKNQEEEKIPEILEKFRKDKRELILKNVVDVLHKSNDNVFELDELLSIIDDVKKKVFADAYYG